MIIFVSEVVYANIPFDMNPEIEYIMRLVIAGLVGGAIGFERELRAKEAGLRTHFLVALGSALFMIISKYAFLDSERFDAARVAAQVVSGIGFIGAGTIIFQKNSVKGLTTAAGMWVTAAIGLACGAGMYWAALSASAFTILCLEAMHFAHRKMAIRNITVVFTTKTREDIEPVLAALGKQGRMMDSFSVVKEGTGESRKYHISVDMKVRDQDYILNINDAVSSVEGVNLDRIE